jgi:hypothetical protein
MKINHRLKPFHKVGHGACKNIESPCHNFLACGPNNSCLFQRRRYYHDISTIPAIPCEYCAFWTGDLMKDWEIENMRTLLEIMENR